jgi:tripartite-type tricarboxylate transporter receptor subunit TctC
MLENGPGHRNSEGLRRVDHEVRMSKLSAKLGGSAETKPLRRRQFISLLAGAIATMTAPFPAAAQDYPSRPITLIVNFPPGGSTDAMARIIREPLSQALGQTVVIDNRGGAGGTTGAAAAAAAKPDGYTLLLSVNSALTTNKYLQKNFPFDPKTAFAPITLMSDVALVLAVHPLLPVHNVTELIEYAKKNPGILAYGSAGVGSSHQICGELIKQKTGIDMVHVPYRGGAPLMQDLLAGNIKVSFSTLPAALPQAQAGRIRIIAAAEKTRLPELPDTPTIDEAIPGIVNVGWNGLLAPAGTSAQIIGKLNALTVAALQMPEVIAKMKLQGLHPLNSTPAEFADLIAREVDHWGRIIPAIGIQPE